MQMVRDFVAVKHIEKKIGRKLTEYEINGLKPVIVTTDDGVRASVFIEVLPFKFFYPQGANQ